MLAPADPEFSAWFSQFGHSCFRLETLQRYGSSGEDASIRTFLAGGDPRPHPGKTEWMTLVSTAVRDSRVMQRVHVVTEPPTDYIRFEVSWSYAYSVAAGEDVRIIPLAENETWPRGIPRPGGDFWLFDDSELFTMHYDANGEWIGVEHVTDPHRTAAARQHKRRALTLARSWTSYINERPELVRRVPDVQWHG